MTGPADRTRTPVSDTSTEVARLRADLEQMLRDLRRLVESIAAEILRPSKMNPSRVTLDIGQINILVLRFPQYMMKLAAGREAQIRAEGTLSPENVQIWNILSAEAYQVRTWISNWRSIEHILREQVPPKRRKLYRNATRTEDITLSHFAAYDAVFDDLHKILNPLSQNEDAQEHGCFADISLPNSVFLEHVHAARRVLLAKRLRHPTRFLDVGCGGGLKVISADKFFDRADGLEFDPGYANAATQLCKHMKSGTCSILQGDALTFDGYGDYDVIYFYRPMRNSRQLQEMEERIVQTARPGTLLIAPYVMFDHRAADLGCARIDNRLYITQTSQSQANDLRRRAEMTGPHLQRVMPNVPSLWDPILKASKAKGFGHHI